MKTIALVTVVSCALAARLCTADTLLPDQAATPRMTQWIDYHYGLFIHFNINTYCPGQHVPVPPAPAVYNPTALDVDGWIKLAQDAGMKYAVLTTKHDGGFCLWDSKVSWQGKEFDYDVASSSNQTDVVQAFVDTCGKYGIAPGFYYCLADTYANKSAPLPQLFRQGVMPEDAFELAKAQLAELATRYPACRYYWLDCPRTATLAQQAGLYDLLRRKNPEIVVLMNRHLAQAANGEQTLLEQGDAIPYPAYPVDVLNTESRQRPKGKVSPRQRWQGKWLFMGYEHCDCAGSGWFHSTKPRPVADLFEVYKTVRQAGGSLLLDVGPNEAGVMPPEFRAPLLELRRQIDPFEASLQP